MDNFFDKQRKTRLTMYDIHMLKIKREKKIKCMRCKKYSLKVEDVEPRIRTKGIKAMIGIESLTPPPKLNPGGS